MSLTVFSYSIAASGDVQDGLAVSPFRQPDDPSASGALQRYL